MQWRFSGTCAICCGFAGVWFATSTATTSWLFVMWSLVDLTATINLTFVKLGFTALAVTPRCNAFFVFCVQNLSLASGMEPRIVDTLCAWWTSCHEKGLQHVVLTRYSVCACCKFKCNCVIIDVIVCASWCNRTTTQLRCYIACVHIVVDLSAPTLATSSHHMSVLNVGWTPRETRVDRGLLQHTERWGSLLRIVQNWINKNDLHLVM